MIGTRPVEPHMNAQTICEMRAVVYMAVWCCIPLEHEPWLHRRAMAGAHGHMTSNGIARVHPSVRARCMHTNYRHVDAHAGRQIHAHARTVSCAPSPSSTSH